MYLVIVYVYMLMAYVTYCVRRPSTISNDFSSETTGPIATKLHIQPSGP